MREESHYIKQTEEGIIQQLARCNGSPGLELAPCIYVQSRVISFDVKKSHKYNWDSFVFITMNSRTI